MKKIIFKIAIVITAILFIAIILMCLALLYAKKNTNYDSDEELFQKAKEEQTIYYYVYDNDGELDEVYKTLKTSMREWTDFEDIGHYLKDGFIAMEDRKFYTHNGINYKRTLLAIFNHIFKIGKSFGGSTITQQVIKNVSGDNETSIQRKVKEIFRALNLEKKHSKDDIFELYLNIVPMSGNIYGVGAAAELYFNKSADELSLSEAATIVGITNAPTRYNPYNNPEACLEKRNRVLYAMLDVGTISKEEYDNAIKTPLKLAEQSGCSGISSWFIETANEEIISDISEKYGLSRAASKLMLNGAKIILTMNPDIQNIMEDYFSNTDNLSDKFRDGLNYSMVVSDPFTGDLLGIIGNGGDKKADFLFNYATSPVTPGSVLKPIALYAPLLDSGKISWSDMYEDIPVEYIVNGSESIPYPKNTPDSYDGFIDINDAIKKSKNTVAVRLYNILGAESIFRHLVEDYGFDTIVKRKFTKDGNIISDMNVSPLALGQLSYGVTLRKLTEAYNVFSNSGVLCKGRSYTKIYDRQGNLIIDKKTENKRIYNEDTVQIMNQLLSGVVNDGTARQITLKENIDTAGKTGTSGNDKDRLFIGYTPYYTCGIWCGYGNKDCQVGYNSPNHLELWDNVMKAIHEKMIFADYNETIQSFDIDKLSIVPYCSKSGKCPTQWCEIDDESEIKFGYFSRRNEVKTECDYH